VGGVQVGDDFLTVVRGWSVDHGVDLPGPVGVGGAAVAVGDVGGLQKFLGKGLFLVFGPLSQAEDISRKAHFPMAPDGAEPPEDAAGF
jgi:hypothetical protein